MKFRDSQHKENFIKSVQSKKGSLPSIDKLMELVKKGMNQSEIALMYKVSRQAVSNAILKAKS